MLLYERGACLQLDLIRSVWSRLSHSSLSLAVNICSGRIFLTVVYILQSLFRIVAWTVLLMLWTNFYRALIVILEIHLFYFLLALLLRLVSATFKCSSRCCRTFSWCILTLILNYSLFETNGRSLMLSLEQRWGPFHLAGLISSNHDPLRLIGKNTLLLLYIDGVTLWQSL